MRLFSWTSLWIFSEVKGSWFIFIPSGSKTLKDAISEALRDWVTNLRDTYYLLGSVVGPHPCPMIVRDFQSVIGREIRSQSLKKEKALPDAVVACVVGCPEGDL